MSKEKTLIHYDIIGTKGFNFNSSTYNILDKNHNFWTTSTKLPSAEIDIKFPPHILTQIDFSNENEKILKKKPIFRKLQLPFSGNRDFQQRGRQKKRRNHLC